jgi:hypothetical protein
MPCGGALDRVLHRFFCLPARDRPTSHERFNEELAYAASLIDRPIHQRLRVARIITLVVAMASIAHDVDHNIAVERLAILIRQAGNADTRFGIITVDMKDRRLTATNERTQGSS